MANKNENKKAKNSEKFYGKANIIEDGPTPIGILIDEFPEDEDDEKMNFCQWEKVGNRSFYPKAEIVLRERIPPGYYKVSYNQDRRSYFVHQREIISDELIMLPIEKGQEIIDDIQLFWQMKERYEKYNLIHKRGILMYGPPGSGKTCILNQLIHMLVHDYKGVIFSIEDSDDLGAFHDFSDVFREIEPERPIIVIIEDIDGLLDGGRGTEKMLLNILDGINQINNVAYIATTNYPERMEARLINRPGRFDRRFKIGYPIAKVRKAFFEAKMHKDDVGKINVKAMVEKTSKLTIAHCKEVFTEHVIKGRDLELVVNEMKKMNSESLHSEDDMQRKKIGFGEDDSWSDGMDSINWNISEAIKKIRKNERKKNTKQNK